MNTVTTIKISKETRERLGKLKEYERETFNEVLSKMFYILNTCRKDPEKAQRVLMNLDRRIKRKDIIKRKMNVDEESEEE